MGGRRVGEEGSELLENETAKKRCGCCQVLPGLQRKGEYSREKCGGEEGEGPLQKKRRKKLSTQDLVCPRNGKFKKKDAFKKKGPENG